MKKKSLYDIAMEQKENKVNNDERVIIIKNKTILLIVMEIVDKILKVLLYAILLILLTIGAMVLVNYETRNFFIDMLKNIC